jgi:hypothetical protein
MQPMPRPPQFEQEIPPYLLKRWIIWDPIPDWLELKPDILKKIFLVTLDIEKEHLAIEQRKIDMVKEIFK